LHRLRISLAGDVVNRFCAAPLEHRFEKSTGEKIVLRFARVNC